MRNIIHGKYGDHYNVEFTLKGDYRMREITFHTLKHHDVETQAVDKIAQILNVPHDSVDIYMIFRVSR